jgi:hypothetical protein
MYGVVEVKLCILNAITAAFDKSNASVLLYTAQFHFSPYQIMLFSICYKKNANRLFPELVCGLVATLKDVAENLDYS